MLHRTLGCVCPFKLVLWVSVDRPQEEESSGHKTRPELPLLIFGEAPHWFPRSDGGFSWGFMFLFQPPHCFAEAPGTPFSHFPWGCLFIMAELWEFAVSPGRKSSSNVGFSNIFSHSACCLFILFTVPFYEQKLWILMKFDLQLLLLWIVLLVCKKSLLDPPSQRVLCLCFLLEVCVCVCVQCIYIGT